MRMNKTDERANICGVKHAKDVEFEPPGRQSRLLVDAAEFCQTVCIYLRCLYLAEGDLGVT